MESSNAVKMFILNPVAGPDDMRLINNRNYCLENYVYSQGLDYFDVVHRTKERGDAKLLAQEFASKYDNPTIFCLGGDGTVSEVINGIGNNDVILVINPCGTGNDFVKTFFGRDRKIIMQNFYECVSNGIIEEIDIGIINNNIRVLNGLSIGLDARVAKIASLMKNKSYIKAIPKALSDFEYPEVRITYFSDKLKHMITLNQKITLLSLNNGKYYGKGVKIAPKADLSDGLFDICLVDKIPKAIVPVFFPFALAGIHKCLFPFVHFDKTDYIKVESDLPFNYQYDGESGITNELELIVDKTVKIIRPRKNH